ncbi:MAG: tRNA (adenosine(37)-N6)-dimethylallyltransferase MiaA [Candidatus Wallbacteria bacterium]|nr:tRNA (adenosine(37)-N6)-dimethylallyltransferase MiaA [Candidatus Wallbacteria bacterium]
MPPAPPRVLFLAGPTASGKSAVAVELALRLGGEIVGMDSMQVYRGLPVLSAAPSQEERARVPHHLVEAVEPGERFDANRFRTAALALVEQIGSRGRLPILAGGSGLYFSALVDGLSELPATDPRLRSDLMERSSREPVGWLRRELERLDPVSAARLHPNDVHRTLRAVEVSLLTGRPYSSQLGARSPLDPAHFLAFALDVPRDELCRRIDARATAMVAAGALQEVARVLGLIGRAAAGGPAGVVSLATARQMLGIPQLLPCLAGEEPLEVARERLAGDTRRFARKQMTWFRRMRQLHWVHAADGRDPASIAEEIAQLWTSGS